jgi:flagellar motility protein MotE (MotC chaperone)
MVRLPTVRTVFWLLALAGAAKAATGFSVDRTVPPARLILASATAPAKAGAKAGTDTKPAAAKAPAAADCKTPEELLQSVRQERALIAKQKAALDDKAAKLDLAKQGLDAETKRLSALQTVVRGLLDKAKQAHSQDVARLVKLYQSMKPVDAAAMLNSVDLQVAVMVLATMKARNAAQIMAKMTPDRVQAVSKIILERSKLPGDQNQVVVTVN